MDVQTGASPKVGRRGLMAKAFGATAVAALLTVAKEAAPAHALSRTSVINGSASTGNYGIAAAIDAFDPGTLVPNITGLGFGVVGTFGSPGYAPPFSAGVLGQGPDAFYGVVGLSQNNPGVWGQSTAGPGVVGRTNGASQPAVRGDANNGIGVMGTSPSIYGVYGVSTSGAGVFGTSSTGIGVYGYSSGSGGNAVGLYGVATSGEGLVGLTQTGIGVHGNAVAGGLAGRFDGSVLVSGAFTVVGGPKSAGVRHADGDYRRMYCQESPEPWFEDFGTAELKNGRAEVTLDPEFDAMVRGDDYLVFLTPVGVDCSLFVSRKGPHKFVVQTVGTANPSGSFDYRVVSRRRDAVGKRLERISAADIQKGKDSPKPLEPRQIADIKTGAPAR